MVSRSCWVTERETSSGANLIHQGLLFLVPGFFAVLGDFNEDGKTDLAGAQPFGIGILDGDGTGAFNDALSYHTTIPRPRYLVAADFNNDGKQDIATASSSSHPSGTGSRWRWAMEAAASQTSL